MLKQYARSLILRTLTIDVLSVTGAFVAAYWIRDTALQWIMPTWFPQPLFPLAAYLLMYFTVLGIWLVLFSACNLYQPTRLTTFKRMPFDITKASAAGLALIMGLTYIAKIPDVS